MRKGHTLRGCVDWNTSSRGPPDGVTCHTLRGCVDWNRYQLAWRVSSEVTPCVGVWIETIKHKATKYNYESHPAWVCGLKHDEILKRFPEFKVTPCVGVWIETERALENEVIDRHTLRGCVDWNIKICVLSP